MDLIVDIIVDALLDSVKLLPFLLGVYLIIGYLENHTNNRMYRQLGKSSWQGPVLGALLGCVPQCGFSVVGANLYSNKMIGLGTLLAIFISTSDEAIPLLIAHPSSMVTVFLILGMKVVLAIAVGVGIESAVGLTSKRRKAVLAPMTSGVLVEVNETLEEGCGCGYGQHQHHDHQSGEHSILGHALKHTMKIFLLVLGINLVLGFLIEGVGEGVLETILLTDSIFQPALAALIGLIPNCAASIVLTEMFIGGALSFGSLLAGLCTGAGMGLVLLFKNNKNLMDNLKILGILYVTGTLVGILLQSIG